MNNKKLDKSLLPKPQHPLGWKKGQLKISTSTANQLLQEQLSVDQAPTRKNSQSNQNNFQFSNKNSQSVTTPQSKQYQQSYNSNHQSQDSRGLQQQMSPSQYSLQQKQLLTFAANHSSESIHKRTNYNKQRQNQGQQVLIRDSNIRGNNFSRANNYQSSQQKKSNQNKSLSKNKEHKMKVYRHNLLQEEQFIAYSVVTKQSRSGMFLNEKLLVLNSFKRQLSYYSNLPKLLPFSSYSQIQKSYLSQNRPKQTIDLDRVRRFMFVPGKGSLASVIVNYINQLGERKQWKLGMGNNAVMNEWIETVNEVMKKQHLSVIKSQVKYPPKPKKQLQNKSNNYQTKFTKTLKQQVLPLIRQSRLTSTNKSIQNNSLVVSNVKQTTNNESSTPKSVNKQYIVESSKFVNTKNYVIDFQDVRNQDIFYVPPPQKDVQEEKKVQNVSISSIKNINNPFQSPLFTKDEPSQNSRFSQQLQKKQILINNQHQNRISTFVTKQPEQNKQLKSSTLYQSDSRLQPEIIPQPFGLSKKSSGDRLSQSTHKDLNIHIDSKISFQEYDFKQEVIQKQTIANNQHEKYFSQSIQEVQEVKVPSISPISHKFQIINQPKSPRKRGLTELATQRHYNQNQNRHSHQVEKQSNQQISPKNNNVDSSFIEGNNSDFSKRSNKKQKLTLKTQKSQIQEIMVGERLNAGYILNFSPHSFGNNWFRLWLETQPSNKVQIYTAFVKACKSIVSKIIDSPQQFSNCYHFTQNNTHIVFSMQNITFKIPFKLHLPQGLGEFITLMDFIKSEDFLAQVFRYRKEIQDQFENYQFILNQLNSEFNNGILSMPIYLPMCCLIKYKGITVLCKPNIESSNLKIHKIPKSEYFNYQSQFQYIEQSSHVSFKLTNQQSPSFDLYQIYLSSFNKSIIYMDNLTKYLPLLANPLQKSNSSTLQLNKTYIEQHIKTGVVVQKKDVNQIQSHIFENVIRNVATQIDLNDQLFQCDSSIFQKGLKSQHFGLVYKRLEQQKQLTKNPQKLCLNLSLLLTQIVSNEYLKVCDIFLMKQFVRQLSSLLTDFNNSQTKSNQSQFSSSNVSNNTKTIKNITPFKESKQLSFGQKFSSTVVEMLHLLICRNTKVWNVIANVVDEKYGISDFKVNSYNNPKGIMDNLLKNINMQKMVENFLFKINAQSQVKSWSINQTWQTFIISEQNVYISPKSKVNSLPLQLFNEDYAILLNQLKIRPYQSFKDLYSHIFQTLNISEQTYQGQNNLITSPQYELLQLGFQKEKLLIDLSLSCYIPNHSKPSKYLSKGKNIDIYKKLLIQSQGRKNSTNASLSFEINLNGIKWLIKQRQFALVQVLIQQQLQSLDIWDTQSLLPIKCKFLDLAALFYHKKLGNKKNKSIQYSLKSLKLSLQNKFLFKLSQLAQKSFQSANIHFESQDLQKSLELYQLTQQIIYESQKNKTLEQSDLSYEFLKIYLKKAQIKLSLGKTTQSLYSCLQSLKKCEQFEKILNNDPNHNDFFIQKLQEIQINVFQVIFRCYEVNKNIQDMRRISKLCCSKFIEDKILIMRMRHKMQTKSLDDSVNPGMMAELLRMCWISLVNQILQRKFQQKIESSQQKPFVPLPKSVKSFYLSGAFQQLSKNEQKKTYKVLEALKEKLLVLCNLYPRNRYDNQTFTSFICQQIVQNSIRINNNKNLSRPQYELAQGKNRLSQRLSSRMEYLIKNSIKEHEYSDSVLYELFSQVLSEFTKNNKANQQQPRKSMQRFAPSFSYTEQRRSRSKQDKNSSIDRQSYTRATMKNPLERFYKSSFQNQPSILPFSLQPDQFQPELSISSKKPINYYNEKQKDFKADNYNNYSLRDQMDKKYMLIEAFFGLCGRQFVIGLLDETIEKQKLKYHKNKQNFPNETSMFYD